jgi:hypothetical protein
MKKTTLVPAGWSNILKWKNLTGKEVKPGQALGGILFIIPL